MIPYPLSRPSLSSSQESAGNLVHKHLLSRMRSMVDFELIRQQNQRHLGQPLRARRSLKGAHVVDILGLPAARHPAIRRRRSTVLLARRESHAVHRLRVARQTPAHLLDVRHLLVLHLHKSARRAAPTLLDRLLVRRDVESNEQEQVGRDDAHTGECRELLARACSSRRQPREVSGREVSVGGEVDEAQVDDELDDLEHGDVLLPPDANAARGLEVVPVHDDVDGEVEDDGHPGHRGVAEQLGVAKQGGRAMVVGVQEGERLLLEEEEDGVDELEVLGEVVELDSRSVLHGELLRAERGQTYVVQHNQLVRPSTVVVADTEEQPIPHQRRDQLLQV